MSIAEKLTTIAENTPKVYDAGYSKGTAEGYSQAESDFWDAFTNSGKRTFYEYGFYGTQFEYIRTPYKIASKSRPLYMFRGCGKLKAIEKNYIDLSGCSVTSQKADTNGWYSTFYLCYELEIVEDVGMAAGGYYYTFNRCNNLHTIEILRVLETTRFEAVFTDCFALENLTIEGTIGQNGFNVSYSTKLSHDSLMSIITALKDYSADTSGTQWVVTIGTTNLNKLTDAEKAIATQKGWTLA